MAIRGRKPTPTFLKLVTGNPGRRPLPTQASGVSSVAPVKPAWLAGRGLELWDEVLGRAPWLTIADSYKLAAWCDRQADFELLKRRKKWTASDRREHRTAGSELGLDFTTRQRAGLESQNGEKDPAARYLG